MRAKRSDVWRYFKKIDHRTSICQICNVVLRSNGNTTNLRSHWRRKHAGNTSDDDTRSQASTTKDNHHILYEEVVCESGANVEIETDPIQVMPTNDQNENEKITERILSMVRKNQKAFDAIQSKGFSNVIKLVAPKYKIPNKETILKLLNDKKVRKSFPTIIQQQNDDNEKSLEENNEEILEIDESEQEEFGGDGGGIDEISPDKLRLSDLLEFKNPPEVQTMEDEENISENHIKLLNETNNEEILYEQQQQTTTTTPETASFVQQKNLSTDSTLTEKKINYFRLKEAEIKYKEEVLRYEHKKIEVARARTEYSNMQELHSLKMQEMRIKLKILTEEEKQLRNKLLLN